MYVVFFFSSVFLFKNANILKLTSFINLRVCAMHADIPFFNIRSDFNALKLFVFVNIFVFCLSFFRAFSLGLLYIAHTRWCAFVTAVAGPLCI